ncbi:hypothetical protein [Cellulomonas biazotea]|uniref:Uncharacterized protein n=1 Tax=Cellulomonas biazotea TaxID=1709 RepID=A0A402DNB5_9CELL|nr:hypothetical protein [Cellulomonas biazotea]GCE75642.1 hypothetical protein CBZ_06980 [Cellulomonas biazotea]
MLPQTLQSRMVAACKWWLGWCATSGIDPLGAEFDDLERAARQMKADGAPELDVLDLLDQVGHLLGLWRDPRWARLRRTILRPDEE